MSNNQADFAATSRLTQTWHKIRACYRYANIVTHHVLGFLLKTVLVLYFLFCLTFLALRYAVLPHIDHYKPDVERLISEAINQPVVIGRLHADWDGLRPRVALEQLLIKDAMGRDALTLPRVEATLSWLSVPTGGLRLYHLEIDNPNIDVRRDIAGNLFIGGVVIPNTHSTDNKGGDWLLSQREIVIRHGTVRWNDNLRGAPELALSEINVELRNYWHTHQFGFHATPPETLAAPLDIRANFSHPAFAASIADPALWDGQLYLDLGKTDLAAWSAYVPLPKSAQIERGHGALRAWLDFKRAKVADFTADLSLMDTALRFQDLPELELDKVSGRIEVKEDIDQASTDGTPTFGAHGHNIALTNFSFRTNDGLALPPTSITESFEPAAGEQPAKTMVSASLLDLQTLATLATRLPFGAELRQVLADYAPRGQLRDFSAQWQGKYPELSAYNVKGQFAGLSMKGQAARPARPKAGKVPAQVALPFIPGFDNLTGQVAMTEQGGDIMLDSSNLQIELPGVFDQPMVPVQKLGLKANWSFQDKDKMLVSIASMNLARDGLSASASGTYQITNPPGGKPSSLADFTARIDRFEMAKIDQYIPAQADEHFRDWITHGLIGGTLRDATIKVKGDMKDFPFKTDSPAERPKGEFTAEGRIVDGVLNYDHRPNVRDPKLPFWPHMEEIQGTIKMNRARLEITADHAKTHNVAMTDVKAVIDEVASPKGVLEVTGTATGGMPDFLGYVVDSPVQQMIGGFTDDSKASGMAKLNLKLTMPLSHMVDTKVQGKLQFMNDDIALIPGLPALNSTSGALEFSEKGFNINNVHTNFLGGPATVNGGGPGDTAAIRGEGTLTAEGVRKYGGEGVMPLTQHLTGGARYTVAINVKKKHTDVIVDTNLNGLALDLPAPLHKEAAENLATHMEMVGAPSNDPNVQREEIKIMLGQAINARYEREKGNERTAPWRLVRGGIGVFSQPAMPNSGVLLNVSMKSLNVDAWTDLITALTADKPRPATPAPAAAAGDSSLVDLVNPDTFAIHANEMTAFGRKIENVVLGASRQNDVWQANVGSTQVAGYFTYVPQGRGQLTAKFGTLVIAKTGGSEVTDLLEGKNVTKDLPALDIEAQDIELFGKHLGALKLKVNNVRKDGANVWSIDDLQVNNPDADLKATGDWTIRNNQSRSSLKYTLTMKNTGGTLGRLGFPGVLRDGAGTISGDMSWNGVPYSFDAPSLSGSVALKVEKGQFVKVDPGAAKLLGVLSLQSLPRRLTLDFRDVFSAGFAFDALSMSGSLQKGILGTKDLKMAGVDATVLMEGSADIVNETQDLHVVVIPKIDAGAASAAYIWINPAIGVGTFLAQLFLRDPLAKAFTEEMQITGPWSDPKVTKLSSKDKKAADANKDGTAANIQAGK